jgi:hypothetical protein
MESSQATSAGTSLGLRRWRTLSLVLVALSAIRVEGLLIATGAGAHLSVLAIISFLVLSPLLLLFLLTIRAKGWPRAVQAALYAVCTAGSAYLLLQRPF